MSYPNSLDVFTNKINNFDEVMAEDVNELQNSIMASQAFFGTLIHMGWLPLPDGEQVSATSFTVEGDHTGLLTFGTKIRSYNAGATKYGYVLSSSYSAGTGLTTVNLIPGSDALASGTLTLIYVSYASPPDFPAELQGSLIAAQAVAGQLNLMGWLPIQNGIYVNATSFTVEGDHTALLKIGAKFRCTNGGVTKYGYVLSSSYASGTGLTTVNLVPNDSYSLAAGTLTQVYVSYANPPDFPAWFDYFATSTITGWSSPTGGLRFKMVGNQVFVDYYLTGTSNATATSFSLPVPHAAGWHTRMGVIAQNNGTQIQGYMQMHQNASLVEFYTTIGWGGWTASGTKAVAGQFFYEGK